MVVLRRAFWLQSTKILPGRTALAIVVVTRSRCWCSSSCPTARAKSAACSWVHGVLSGTYSCRPFDPDVLAKPSQVHRGQDVAHQQRHLAALLHRRRRTRVEVEHHRARRVEVVGQRHRHVQLERGHVGRPHQRGRLVDPAVRRCRRCGRPGRAPSAPTPAGASGSASRRSRRAPRRRGSACSVMQRPARCGSITGAMRA